MAAGYADELLGRVCGSVAACTRRVSRVTRRLLRHRGRVGVVGASESEGRGQRNSRQQAHQAVVAAALCARGAAKIDKQRGGGGGGEAAPALWSRRILMGERCQPLDFAGGIHYDSFGRRLARPPTPPRSASASSSHLSCVSLGSVDDTATCLVLDNGGGVSWPSSDHPPSSSQS